MGMGRKNEISIPTKRQKRWRSKGIGRRKQASIPK